jgi:site-specific DNA-methyltransferase (adenine-specific)
MPEQLLGRIIRSCSNPGELVLDPFSGSASTLIVAKKLGRRFLGCDLSPEYVAQGTTRLEATTAGDPLVGAPEPLVSAPATPEAEHVPESKRRRIYAKRKTATGKASLFPE